MTSIGVITVATNIYVEYWNEMVRSFDAQMGAKYQLVFHVFTDRVNSLIPEALLINKSKIEIHEISPLVWPEAALNYFDLVHSKIKDFKQDILMNMDADMLVNSEFDEQFSPDSWVNGLAFVLHPGYYIHSTTFKLNKLEDSKLKKIFKSITTSRSSSPVKGSWETNPESSAFVSPANRVNYYCGAVWMGRRENFSILISELCKRVELDRQKQLTAIWLDESHINGWASTNQFSILTPNYCFDPNTCNGKGLQNIIEAVEKGENRTR